MEEHFYHPIATAVVKKAEDEGIEHEEMHGKLTHVASKGIVSSIDGKRVVIGSLELLEDEKTIISNEQKAVIEEYSQKYNLLYLSYDGKLIAIFLIDTPLRGEAIALLKELKKKENRLYFLQGIHKNVQKQFAR